MAIKEKFSVSLDRDVLASIRKIAGAGRVSEWLNEAALLRLQEGIVAELEREHGPVPPEITAEIETAWPA